MSNRYKQIPEAAIPAIGTDAREALDLMFGDKPTPRSELVAIDDNIRRLLQPLEGDQYGYWVIDRIHVGGARKATHFKVNDAHFAGKEEDLKARALRRLQLKQKSFKQATSESKRIKKAKDELATAIQNVENAQQI